MQKIEVRVISEHGNPGSMMTFLARLTQRGHKINEMADLINMYQNNAPLATTIKSIASMSNHGTIKRFTPITIAVVGASRRFLAQIRTHSVGINFVSASLQYSDYSENNSFVVPFGMEPHRAFYLKSCKESMDNYSSAIAAGVDNDSAGYLAPQGLRNILIIQGNHEAWINLIRLRGCNRNTEETQYVVYKIWEALLGTTDAEEMFEHAGPDCLYGKCKEGKMSCRKVIDYYNPTEFIKSKWGEYL